jgi:hypothetical protein
MDESDTSYMRRLLSTAKRHSDQWSAVDINRVPTDALPVVFRQVVDDGVTRFKAPLGELRQHVTLDDSGRKIRRFYGDTSYCWDVFKPNVIKRVTGWNQKGYGKGANAPGATRPVGTLMSDGSVRAVRPFGQ